METALRRAIVADELLPYFQPFVSSAPTTA